MYFLLVFYIIKCHVDWCAS